MRRCCSFLFIVPVCLVLAGSLFAEVPNIISFQGRLTTPEGDAVPDGSYLIKFIIWDAPAGGSEIWNSGFQNVTSTDGLFAVELGAPPMPTIPPNIWWDTSRYVGVTVGTDPEMVPRTRLTSGYASYLATFATWAYHSDVSEWAKRADTAQWDMLQGVPAGFADGVDNDAGGDITSVTVGAGLTGGGTGGAVTVAADVNYLQRRVTGSAPAGNAISAINADGSISTTVVGNGDITSVTAGAALVGGGTSGDVTLGLANSIPTAHTFTNTIKFGDSTLTANYTGIRIGDNGTPLSGYLVYMERNYNTPSDLYGLKMYLSNSANGNLYGLHSIVDATTPGAGGLAYAIYGLGRTDASARYGGILRAQSHSSMLTTGSSYGGYGSGEYGAYAYGLYGYANLGTYNYGVYGTTGGSGYQYAGYFSGNVVVTGNLSKGSGSFMIDHPLDPENKYLQHSFVESPDMMNVYNGNVTLDAEGQATIVLPDWFEALNRDFRYQLTCLGAFAPVYVAQEVSGNQFAIAGGTPGLRVSWQVTGIRKDAFAEANRIQVEIDKPADQRGEYLHPEAFGLDQSRGVDWKHRKDALQMPDREPGDLP